MQGNDDAILVVAYMYVTRNDMSLGYGRYLHVAADYARDIYILQHVTSVDFKQPHLVSVVWISLADTIISVYKH